MKITLMSILRFIVNVLLLVPLAYARCRRSVDDSTAACEDPPGFEPIPAERYAYLTQATTSSIYPGWSDDDSFDTIPEQFKNVTIIHFQGNQDVDCDSDGAGINTQHRGNGRHRHNHLSHGRRRINHIATCPFRYVKNWDPNRLPSTLLEARCQCPYPGGLQGGVCQETHMYVSVLRRAACELGQWSYARVWERISIGCITLNFPPPSGQLQDFAMPRMSAK